MQVTMLTAALSAVIVMTALVWRAADARPVNVPAPVFAAPPAEQFLRTSGVRTLSGASLRAISIGY